MTFVSLTFYKEPELFNILKKKKKLGVPCLNAFLPSPHTLFRSSPTIWKSQAPLHFLILSGYQPIFLPWRYFSSPTLSPFPVTLASHLTSSNSLQNGFSKSVHLPFCFQECLQCEKQFYWSPTVYMTIFCPRWQCLLHFLQHAQIFLCLINKLECLSI